MTTFQHPHRVELLSSSFQYPDRRLFFTRARLFLDRIELSGWQFGKKHERRILLDELQKIEWDGGASQAVFHLSEEESVRLRLPQLDSWKHSLEQRLSWSAPGRFRIAAPASHTARRDLPLQDLVTLASAMG